MKNPTPAFAILLFLSDAFAGENTRVLIRDQWVHFRDDPARSLTVSEKCPKDCLALRAFRKVGSEDYKSRPAQTALLGAWLCEEVVSGKIVIGRNFRGGENAYCEFKDGSLIDTGSLSFAQTQHSLPVKK